MESVFDGTQTLSSHPRVYLFLFSSSRRGLSKFCEIIKKTEKLIRNFGRTARELHAYVSGQKWTVF